MKELRSSNKIASRVSRVCSVGRFADFTQCSVKFVDFVESSRCFADRSSLSSWFTLWRSYFLRVYKDC